MTSPEPAAREMIDRQLETAGWGVQDMAELNVSAARGVIVREMRSRGGLVDYVPFVDGNALAIVSGERNRPEDQASSARRIPLLDFRPASSLN